MVTCPTCSAASHPYETFNVRGDPAWDKYRCTACKHTFIRHTTWGKIYLGGGAMLCVVSGIAFEFVPQGRLWGLLVIAIGIAMGWGFTLGLAKNPKST